MDRKCGMRVASSEEFGGLGSSGAIGGEEGMRQLKWDQQGTRLAKQLRALYDDQEGVGNVLGLQPDVALFSSDGEFVTAHRMVLTLCSPYFEELFGKISQVKSLKGNDGPAVVVLGNVKALRLQQLLQFIYTGEVTVSADQMEEFLEIGSFFQIEGIMESNSVTVNVDGSQVRSCSVIKTADDQVLVADSGPEFEKCSKAVHRGNTSESPVASTSATIIYEDLPDEDVDISYDSYPIKVEEESAGVLEEDIDAKDDPLQCRLDEELGTSDEEMNDEEDDKNDPTYEETPSKAKQTRRTSGPSHIYRTDSNTQDQVKTTNVYWDVQDHVSDQSLELSWRVVQTKQLDSGFSITYYCAAGLSQCPARLKKKILKDGTVVWLNNGIPHSPHPPVHRKRKPPKPKPVPVPELTSEQSQFVVQCLQGGVITPNEIILKFKVQGLVPPGEQSLRAFLKCRAKLRSREQTKE